MTPADVAAHRPTVVFDLDLAARLEVAGGSGGYPTQATCVRVTVEPVDLGAASLNDACDAIAKAMVFILSQAEANHVEVLEVLPIAVATPEMGKRPGTLVGRVWTVAMTSSSAGQA